MKRLRGVVTDPLDGEVVYEIELDAESIGNQHTKPTLPVEQDQDQFEVAEPDIEREIVEIEDPADAMVDERPRLSDRYAALRDRLRPASEALSRKYAELRPRVAQRAGQLQAAIAIAAEEYQGGIPKPKPRPKPKKKSPRLAEFEDKYKRIGEVFRSQAQETPRPARQRSGRSASTGMKSRTSAGTPSIRIVRKSR